MTTNATSPASHPVSRVFDPFQIAGDIDETADRLRLTPACTASVTPRPKDTAGLWVEVEYEQFGLEQVALWEATRETETRAPAVKQAGLALHTGELEHVVTGSRELLEQARTRYLHTASVLAAHRRRAVGSKRWYQAAKAVIFVGDLAGFATAAIWLGEPTFIALALAGSAAAATVVAGLVGTEYSDMRRRALRETPSDELPVEVQPFAHLFATGDRGGSILKRVLLLALVTALMIAVGIGALRATVDDPLIGVLFAGIAFAVAGGSFLVSYAGADEVADLIDLAKADYETRQNQHLKLAADASWQSSAESAAERDSISTEIAARGVAAVEHVRALKYRILRNNPAQAGHGPRPDDPVGRAPRKGAK
ncbi:hypothetical protein M2390_000297 [Mycetocola sp. BIGb0189]|uniref:hypothetical protein n=1 Tax=Mycetocola sp. BIGb0189 TaxID=2940604 RepID=UPI00216A689E|nr:hypothetical protein [Mycetocola sp. BIGb0189]MCS4275139.1 hypothetical protein [Mycetocola sp. BIGb0189]